MNNLAWLRRFKPIRRKLLFIVLAIFGIGLAGLMLQDRDVASRAIDSNRQIAQIEEQQSSVAETAETIQIQDSSIANPKAKPGEVGEILIDQPKKGIKYIRAGTLVLSPSTLTCYVGYTCSSFTVSTSDGRPIARWIDQKSDFKIWVTCREDCGREATQKTSLRLGLELSQVGPGTYPLNLEATHLDVKGNHLIYFGLITLILKDPDPGYIPPPEPAYDMGTPPPPSSGFRCTVVGQPDAECLQ